MGDDADDAGIGGSEAAAGFGDGCKGGIDEAECSGGRDGCGAGSSSRSKSEPPVVLELGAAVDGAAGAGSADWKSSKSSAGCFDGADAAGAGSSKLKRSATAGSGGAAALGSVVEA